MLSQNFENAIDEIQEYHEQLKRSMELSYDEQFHRDFTKKYSNFIKSVLNSTLSSESKLGYLARLHDIFV